MLSYLWIGANDVDASVAFYDSLFYVAYLRDPTGNKVAVFFNG